MKWDDHLADWPECQSSELQMGPGKGNTDDRERQQKRGHQVGERQPPAGKDEPNDVADEAKWPSPHVLVPYVLGSRDRLLSEGKECVSRDVKGRSGQGSPMMVMAMTIAAITQATAIHRPPESSQSTLSNIETGCMSVVRKGRRRSLAQAYMCWIGLGKQAAKSGERP